MAALSVPAPIGGWNARDALDQMEQTDAVRLVNLIPRAGYVESRKGHQLHVSGLGSAVFTLAPYRGITGEKLIACAGGQIWDATNAGAPVSLSGGFTSNFWQYLSHSDRLVFVNGANFPRVYDGATVALATLSGSGLTPAQLYGCTTFKGRAFYWEKSTQGFWYAAAGAFQGALTRFDLSGVITAGGVLMQVFQWTLDAGDGVDDLAVFVFSTGEVLVYQGDDPGDANRWALTGRFKIGEPISVRAHAKVGGTEVVLTKDGYVDIAQALRDGRYSEKSAYSNKIIRAAKEAAQLYAIVPGFTTTGAGWECVLYPAGNLFIVNVPISATESLQHVRDTTSGGWCSFDGMGAHTFAVHKDKLYFGGEGSIYQADIGVTDVGNAIPIDAVPAFNTMGSRARRKQMTAVSVVSSFATPTRMAIDGLSDFDIRPRSQVGSEVPGAAGDSTWDVATWDVDPWSFEGEELGITTRSWRNCSAIGYTLTISLRAQLSSQTIIWYSVNYLYKNAGVL